MITPQRKALGFLADQAGERERWSRLPGGREVGLLVPLERLILA
jgi:hypothetical protein